MKVSLNWLREFVTLPPTVPALVELLTLAGVEVEGVEPHGVDLPGVVVAQIRESAQHPNADRLSVCQVDDGSGTARQIVCGAKNYQAGDKVPLALPGAVLPGDFKIKVGKLRGVESQGMLCSAEELGLPKGADGLLILEPHARVGAPLAELFPGDTVLDLEVTPNRPDLLSHFGMAREIAALTGQTVKPLSHERPLSGFSEEVIDVSSPACHFYSALQISGLKVGPSPEWLRRRLETVGLRPINNVVDITNYVMFETGQPLHAFDAAKLSGAVRVRQARAGEELVTLDGRTRQLDPQHLVIADEVKAVALGGVMGGLETGVTDGTQEIVLESAWFEPASIRRTARELSLASDSSYRFERGVDLAGVLPAAVRAAALLARLASGVVGELGIGLADDSPAGFDPVANFSENEGPVYTHTAPFRAARCRTLLGLEVSDARIAEILEDFGLRRAGKGWEIPSYRQDLQREVDLIEEVARVSGIAAIPSRTQGCFAPASPVDSAYDRAMNLRRALAAHGFHEARSLTLVPAEPLGMAFTPGAGAGLHRVRNPMIDDQVALRPNLLHGLLKALSVNLRAGAAAVQLFEIGRVYRRGEPEETTHAALLLHGPLSARSWRGGGSKDADLFDLKGVLEAVLGPDLSFTTSDNPALALSLTVQWGARPIGWAGQLWPAGARALDATGPILFGELDLDALAAAQVGTAAKYHEIARFPVTSRDIALLAPLDLPHQRIAAALAGAGEPLLSAVELFDVFADPAGIRVPAEKKSLAYSLTYRASNRTLTTDEVTAAHARLKEHLKASLGVTLRE